ncbi:hypothetical protein CEXT_201761, partial [Caerostris extrusa]
MDAVSPRVKEDQYLQAGEEFWQRSHLLYMFYKHPLGRSS